MKLKLVLALFLAGEMMMKPSSMETLAIFSHIAFHFFVNIHSVRNQNGFNYYLFLAGIILPTQSFILPFHCDPSSSFSTSSSTSHFSSTAMSLLKQNSFQSTSSTASSSHFPTSSSPSRQRYTFLMMSKSEDERNPYYKGMDSYQILECSRTTDKKDIKAAYRRLLVKWHPDKFVKESDAKKKEAALRMEKISRAYYTLGDDERKERYDKYGDGGVGQSESEEEQLKQAGGPNGGVCDPICWFIYSFSNMHYLFICVCVCVSDL